jgi:hypothetical protein
VVPPFPSDQNLDNFNDIPASHSPHLDNHLHNPSCVSPHYDDRSRTISPLSPRLDPHFPTSSFNPPFLQFLDNHTRILLHNSQNFQSSTLIDFSQCQPATSFAAPQPIPAQPAPFLSCPLPPLPPPIPPPPVLAPPTSTASNLPTSLNIFLPSTEDVPLLLGKHDWGPWHSAVRTLILNATLLDHIADDPYPGATVRSIQAFG